MATDTKLIVDILRVIQACIWTAAFGVIIAEVVDSDETKSFKSSLLVIIPWLLVCTLLMCVFEHIGNLITNG